MLNITIVGLKNQEPVISFIDEEGKQLIFDISIYSCNKDIISFSINEPQEVFYGLKKEKEEGKMLTKNGVGDGNDCCEKIPRMGQVSEWLDRLDEAISESEETQKFLIERLSNIVRNSEAEVKDELGVELIKDLEKKEQTENLVPLASIIMQFHRAVRELNDCYNALLNRIEL